MSSPRPPILKDVYNVYCDKSFFTGKNFNVNYDPKTMDNNMIPYDKLEEFHYQTSFFLNFYSSLYIELKKYEIDNNYDISNFSKTIEKLGIIIDNTTIFGTGDGKTFNLSSFPQGTGDRIEYRNFIFYNKTFEKHSSAGNHSYLYTPSGSGNTTNSNAYIKDYLEILDKSKPEFDTTYNITDINNLILIKSGNTQLTNMDILTKLDLIITDDNKTKFKEIIQEVLSQKPENILAYLLNKKIYYNIILFNIYIQKQIRTNYLNYIDNIGITKVNNIIKFTANKEFVINNDITCKILIVGGGGGGGYNGGGGGGGGQVKYEDIRLTSGNYSIIIGNGGAGSRGSFNGSNGNSSYISKNNSLFKIEAKGGGGGGGDSGKMSNSSMGTSGDIGGAGGNGENSPYTNIPTSNNNGGSGGTTIGFSSGGGGGGGYASNTNKNGKNSCQSYQSGSSTCSDGGFGFTITISNNNNESYGGGGGGGTVNSTYRGGNGKHGGGDGGYFDMYSQSIQATNGRVNTGGGGGGGVSHGAGGNGGSGIIILFFESDYSSFLSFSENINTTYDNLKTYIDSNIYRIDILKKRINNSDFLIEKNKYISKINILNSLTDEYNKIQDNLNISIKLYNQQYKVYNIIKKYAIYVIIALIIKIIIIFFLSIFPIFSNEIKYGIYIILLIILIIITFIYYINFKYINLYEKFYSQPPLITKSSPSQNTYFYNEISPYINKYINAVKELLNDLRMNIYTVGSKSFSQDTNTYLYKYYLEKKKKNTNNNIKLTNLFNIIEVIKKQIIYLFNIVFIIACFIIILLISLILYLIVPYLYIYIIILCVILITILMIYFAFAIIQPTRMIANKNYWANNNPSKNTIENL
jgi:hypothetical protein